MAQYVSVDLDPTSGGKDLERVIGFWGGLALIVGITIGGGIFRKPYTLARDVGDPAVILGAVGRASGS